MKTGNIYIVSTFFYENMQFIYSIMETFKIRLYAAITASLPVNSSV